MSPNNTQLDEENEIQSDTSPELVDDFEQDEEMSDIIFVSTSMEFATHRPIRIIVHENNSKKMQETKNWVCSILIKYFIDLGTCVSNDCSNVLHFQFTNS